MTTSECKTCHAKIIWVVTPSGKSMPLDARAETVWVLDPEGAQQGSPRAKPMQAYRSHFSTCVDAAQHRRPR